MAHTRKTLLLDKDWDLTLDKSGRIAVAGCLYNPDLQLGGMIEVKTVVPGAEGTWKITKLSHSLVANSNAPSDWFSEVEASPLDAQPKEKKTSKEKK